ncbi:hypothetical protein [Streptomyces globisporus]|uniref:hypothetical protein n=1 Tax=Streptomyces globisporus TaxID=1908 RepID=UPI00369C0189
MQLRRTWGLGLVTAAVLIGGGATIAHAASGASHHGGDRPAVVLPEGEGAGSSAGDSQAYPLPEEDRPGTPAGDETYRP